MATCFPTFAVPVNDRHASLPPAALPRLANAELLRHLPKSQCPFGALSTEDQLPPGLPPPGYRRHAQGLSPSPRLHGLPCAPGLFHPGHAHGVPPFRAFSLCRAVVPLDTRCLPGVCRTRPAPDRSPVAAATSATSTGHPYLAAREAKRLGRRPGTTARR
jgi:hypothetical protein